MSEQRKDRLGDYLFHLCSVRRDLPGNKYKDKEEGGQTGDLNSAERFSKIMDSEFPLSYTDHQNIYSRTHIESLWKDLEKLEK